jgi:Tol biopolymer transport system component
MLVAQVIIIIYTSSVFLLLPLHSNQYAFGTLAGANEKIVFYSNRDGNQEIYIMNAADGSNQTRLTDNPANDSNPRWSPDGTKIAFNTNRDSTEQENFENHEIYIMNAADGSNQTRLTNDPAWDSLPSWSPDGTLIAFYSERDVGGDIYIMNAADGSNPIRLTDSPAWDSFPSWSPNATNIEIAFDSDRDANQEIYIMKFTGGVIQTSRLTFNNVTDTGSSWSPDGTKLAFASSKDGNSEIYVMNAADGSGQIRLTNNTAADGEPDW